MADILDLFKRQHIEPVQVVQENPSSFDVLGVEQKHAPMVDSTENVNLGEVTDEKYPWIQQLFNRAVPDKIFFETNALLAQILDVLNSQRQNTVPTDYLHVKRTIVQPSQTLEFTSDDISPFGYLYIPSLLEPGNTSTFAPVNIYHGYSVGTPLVMRHESHAHLTLALPNTDVVTFQVTNVNASQAKTFIYYLSTRPILAGSGQTNI